MSLELSDNETPQILFETLTASCGEEWSSVVLSAEGMVVVARSVSEIRKRLRKMRRKKKRRSRRRRPIQKNPQTGKVDLDVSPMMFNRSRDGGKRKTMFNGKKVQVRSLHKPKPLVGPWEPKNKRRYRIWKRKYDMWKQKWKGKWDSKSKGKKPSSLAQRPGEKKRRKKRGFFDEVVRVAYENPEIRDYLFPLLSKYAEEEGGESSGGSKGRPGAMMIEFLKETGDLKVTSPTTGNKIKIKSLSGSEEGKKKLKRLFDNWKKQKERLKGKKAAAELRYRVAHLAYTNPPLQPTLLPLFEVEE